MFLLTDCVFIAFWTRSSRTFFYNFKIWFLRMASDLYASYAGGKFP